MAAKRIGLYSLFYRSKIPCKTLVPLRPAYSQSEDKKFLTDGESKDCRKETGWQAPLMDHETLVSYMLKKSDAKLDYGEIYIKRPHEEDQLKGRKERKIRFVWEEQDCTESFPDSPEACNLDLLHYLEQRDMWERRRVLHIPKFCVGSIIAVTRADEYAPLGFSRYSPIPCVYNLVKVNKKTPNGSILMFHLYSLWKLFIPPCFIK